MSADSDGVRCMQLRGGSSKGAYFLGADLPADPDARADLLLRIMGSPDERQIDGIGGGHPLTSKVAVVSRSTDDGADVDYLFLQVVPDRAIVTAAQTCGNLLAGVGPFAIERGLVAVSSETTEVRIRIMNPTIGYARARISTPAGRVRYAGDTVMAGTPFPAAPIEIEFPGSDRPLFPTGRLIDRFAGIEVTCVDAGMPVVLIRAKDLDLDGTELPATLEASAIRSTVEEIRRAAGPAMGLGDVTDTTVPKITIFAPPRHGGAITTRTFIPHRVHAAIGVLGAVSVAAAVRIEGTVAADLAPPGPLVRIEHPTGTFEVAVDVDGTRVNASSVIRTARKLSDGLVWPRTGKATG
ncbi:4-oxalomesaconate tautomerase [Asanoa ferruginea]|uniref:4-oxalomesaconate tautomerase n=1 Tax=Asanoa ferruginea TaxID=53367 RepID=A0A3D9ZR85_9ACTN|nr:PrpF domain-containing protein [Asanoa ferruginea]REF99389.1 4-oxalomesaconate tautomerase [Asanoa ferruginea]GIF45993.1 FldA protein [Asanoa ferruginea]